MLAGDDNSATLTLGDLTEFEKHVTVRDGMIPPYQVAS